MSTLTLLEHFRGGFVYSQFPMPIVLYVKRLANYYWLIFFVLFSQLGQLNYPKEEEEEEEEEAYCPLYVLHSLYS